MITCLITGCTLFDSKSNRYVRGDLFGLDNHTYIFNACIENNETDWLFGPCPADKVITIADNGTYFERRGVIVFGDDDADLNEAAANYLDKSIFYMKDILS
jgi:hypothetical protein